VEVQVKILMLHNEYQGIGGETLSVQAEVHHLQEAGLAVEYMQFAPASDDNPWKVARELVYSRPIKQVILDQIEQFRPDIVHLQNVFPRLGGSALSAISATNIPFVQTLRNYRLSCLSANHYRDEKPCTLCRRSATAIAGIRFGCYRESRMLSGGVAIHDAAQRSARMISSRLRPRAFIVLSEKMRHVMQPSLPAWANVCVKYNTLTSDPGTGIGGGGIIFVGRLSADKGVLSLLEAWQSLSSRPPLTIIGDGPLRTAVESVTNEIDGIEFHQSLPHSEVLRRIQHADLLAAPAMWHEPFGRTVMEALACSTPVLATDRGAAQELIGPAGWICEPNVESIRQGVCKALVEAPQYRERARVRYESVLSPTVTTRRLIDIYELALGSP
jgi:glycosyltransferase involved in cell wall biosynthesis